MKVFSDETPLNGEIYASPTVAPPELPLLVPLPPRFATRDRDRDRTATPIVGRRRRSRDRSFSSRWGAVDVKPDNEMEIDIKGQGEVKDAASADSITADAASADTASADTATADTAAADTAAAEPPRKPLRSDRDVGGEMGRCRRERRCRRLETNLWVSDLQVPTRNKGKSY